MYAQTSRPLGIVSGLAAVLVFTSGCATAATGPRFTGSNAPEDQQVAIEVRNIGWADVTVYSMSGGSRIRLGTVTANTAGRFKLPRGHEWSTDLRLMADPLGSGRTYSSPRISPANGQVVRWTVHETASFRTMFVW